MGKFQILAAIIVVISLLLFGMKNEGKSSEFESWKVEFNVRFDSTFEDAYREKIFLRNLQQIRFHNSDPHRTYDKGLNQFAALTQKEFIATYTDNSFPSPKQPLPNNEINVQSSSIDWVSKGAVTPVVDERACLAGYAFSAVGALQSSLYIANNKTNQSTLIPLSVQQVVDCSNYTGNHGCFGGYMTNAFEYIKTNGVVEEYSYPFTGFAERCKYSGGSYRITGYVGVHSCDDLASALKKHPVSVGVDASNWRFYDGGIFSDCRSALNHGAVLVGMTNDYWKVKNSWGNDWGEGGYIRLPRGNVCGICNDASYPTF